MTPIHILTDPREQTDNQALDDQERESWLAIADGRTEVAA